MYIDDFAWLPDIIDKLAAKHGVTQDEAEVFFNRPRFRFVEEGHRRGKMCMPLALRAMRAAT